MAEVAVVGTEVAVVGTETVAVEVAMVDIITTVEATVVEVATAVALHGINQFPTNLALSDTTRGTGVFTNSPRNDFVARLIVFYILPGSVKDIHRQHWSIGTVCGQHVLAPRQKHLASVVRSATWLRVPHSAA